jgi:hypothetical protein
MKEVNPYLARAGRFVVILLIVAGTSLSLAALLTIADAISGHWYGRQISLILLFCVGAGFCFRELWRRRGES